MLIIALDLRKFHTACCFYDTQSREYRFETAFAEREYQGIIGVCEIASTKATRQVNSLLPHA